MGKLTSKQSFRISLDIEGVMLIQFFYFFNVFVLMVVKMFLLILQLDVCALVASTLHFDKNPGHLASNSCVAGLYLSVYFLPSFLA